MRLDLRSRDNAVVFVWPVSQPNCGACLAPHLIRASTTTQATRYSFTMSRDSNRTYVHFRLPRIVEQYEDYCRDKLPNDEVYLPPEHQPINPEDEDDVIPDQHAAFGIARAQQKVQDPMWKDLGLDDLMHHAPTEADHVPEPRSKLPR